MFSFNEYFDNIEDFVKRLHGDLTNCDLSKAQNIAYDFSKCKIDDTTCFPISANEDYEYIIEKAYRKDKFFVTQTWRNKNGIVIKEYKHEFEYFCDFIAFLNGDLSNADLISCDGLSRLVSMSGINLSNALLTSSVSKALGVPCSKYSIENPGETSFEPAKHNEEETSIILQLNRDYPVNQKSDLMIVTKENIISAEHIYYISDIHLYHLLKNKKIETKSDIIRVVRDLAQTIIDESKSGDIVLINGDTSLNFSVFKLFAIELAKSKRTIIFTLGNHEIWSCPDDTFDQITEKYRSFLNSNGMYLLQNDVLYFEDFELGPERITEEEIEKENEEELRSRIKSARLIIFGGTGFAGYNQFYNAEYGLYRYNNTFGCNRDIEIKETQKFEALYNKICRSFHGKNVVIMTHMPLPDWYGPAWQHRIAENTNESIEETAYHNDHPEDNVGIYSVYQQGFIYLSGHTHRNFYYDDGAVRIYADNQFGYNINKQAAWPHLKYFEVEKEFDYFFNYDDGIYKISVDDYKRFYRGKNITMDCNRKLNILYMLKKKGYYCFIHQSEYGFLSIMNGGTLKRLFDDDIHYYYENMESEISLINSPLEKYTAFQNEIARQVKELGGKGTIHGCIVDIDFYNHIYVNPMDGTITGYWASDIINKMIYPTIPALLEVQCPTIFLNYKKMLSGKIKNNLPAPFSQECSQTALKSVPYLDTDIYNASRQIKKMQRLNSNILTIWPDELL